MCGRYTVTVTIDELLLRYATDIKSPFHTPRYNIAPTQIVPAVVNKDGRNQIVDFKWGLIPPWAKDEKIAYKTFNARAETLEEKPSFRSSIKYKRCLIIADSFYEWKNIGIDKQPMRIQLINEKVFSFAGLHETWSRPGGEVIQSCCIITTTSNELMKDIHDRMPVILRREDELLWLNQDLKEPEKLRHLLVPYDSKKMYAYPVSNRVGNVRNNDENLIQKEV
ncbi:MAG: SOS response-associated peptidase [Paenibacillaceae bacterium]